MTSRGPHRCASCGGLTRGGLASCRAAFDELLAFEFVDPAAFGPVHHLTVACFFLQHPEGHTAEVLAMWRHMISEPEAGASFATRELAAARRAFDGPTRVREAGARPPHWWPTTFPVTVWDVLPGPGAPLDAAGHVQRVRQWAHDIGAVLDRADPTRA